MKNLGLRNNVPLSQLYGGNVARLRSI